MAPDDKGSSVDQSTQKVKSYAFNTYYNKSMPYYANVYDGSSSQGVIKDKFKQSEKHQEARRAL